VFNDDQLDYMRYLNEAAKRDEVCNCGWYIKGKDAYQEAYCKRVECNVAEAARCTEGEG
jgi:hypothetical protein